MNIYEEFLKESNAIEKESWPDDQAVHAFDYALEKLPVEFTANTIRDIHQILMYAKRPDISGRVRDVPVYIGGQMKPGDKIILESRLAQWCHDWDKQIKSMKQNVKSSALIEALLMKSHVEFEDIHPFVDGNGRTGRILWQVMRQMCGLPTVAVIHSGPEQMEYYKLFK